MIRHYEKLGLLPPATRTGGNYREYADDDVRRLRLIGRARELGIAMETIADVMRVWDRPASGAAELQTFGKALAERSSAAAELTAEIGQLLDHSRKRT